MNEIFTSFSLFFLFTFSFFFFFFSFVFVLPLLIRKKIGRSLWMNEPRTSRDLTFLIFDLKLIIVPNEMNGILIVDNCLG